MFAVAEELRNTHIAVDDSVTVHDKAVVPIIKFTDKRTQVKVVEVSFNEKVACLIQESYQTFIKRYPQLPVLLLIIKQLLTWTKMV